jgi:CubicO group peptidase (beta-lactamase class C family)
VKTFPPSDCPILPVTADAPAPPGTPPPAVDGAALRRAFAGLEDAVARGLVPGAVAAVGTAAGTLHRQAFGWAALTPRRRPLDEDARFDLASLTKIVATTTLLLRFLERGCLFLEQPVASVLPAFGVLGKERVTFRHLLTHTSGLPAWRDLREDVAAGGDPLRAVLRQPLERPSGAAVVYSDLGFITLGQALSAIGGAPLDVLVRREVLDPLEMTGTGYLPHGPARDRCVATEDLPQRGGVLTGVVHDDNAHLLGGVSGHAGLFAPCADLERFCRLWLGEGRLPLPGAAGAAGGRLLSPATVRLATSDQTGGDARRGLGWVLQPNPFWVPADLCSPGAYSHTGFTGTSLLIDPGTGLYAVLLTSRVHPTRENNSAGAAREVRGRFHNAVWGALEAPPGALAPRSPG